jgi:hypothetical protein
MIMAGTPSLNASSLFLPMPTSRKLVAATDISLKPPQDYNLRNPLPRRLVTQGIVIPMAFVPLKAEPINTR